MSISMKVPVPVDATLRVSFDHVDIADRDATPEDLAALGLVDRHELYARLRNTLALLVSGDAATDLTGAFSESPANLVRYLIETAVFYADTPEAVLAHLGDGDDDDESLIAALRALLSGPVPAAEPVLHGSGTTAASS